MPQKTGNNGKSIHDKTMEMHKISPILSKAEWGNCSFYLKTALSEFVTHANREIHILR
ncbi:hypothetical protein JCM6294_3775 [Bacteroides pyogenes DSM 20611 = JCM 6294]|uniref:Uncharacterized protein n=1 Tax=Bacteroides pyogenes DSM 20611 = JCM 6294 TaxID=1121100 RepID=W4PLF9_9BACE|nr:hypothetical protein JCM6294_3775 [Bacteroides pyogenes DSM 20611 = JCM 6294]